MAKPKEARIELGGRERLLRLSFNAICVAEEVSRTSYMDQAAIRGYKDLRALFYGGLVEGARVSEQPVDFTLQDVGDWMQDSDTATVTFLELWTDFMPAQEEAEEAGDGPPGVQEKAG